MSGFTTTPNYGLRKPAVGADTDLWGGDWNLNADTIDTQIKARADAIASVQTSYLPLAGGQLTGSVTDVGGSASNVLSAATPRLVYAFADAAGSIAGGFTPDGTWRIGRLSFTLSDGGRLTGPLTDAGGATTAAADARIAGPFQCAWADPAGNIAMEILQDGTLKVGTLSATNFNATNFNVANPVVPQITIGGDLFAPPPATVPGKFALADPSGAIALLLDNNGILRARTLSGYTLDQMATMPQLQQAPPLGYITSRYITGTYASAAAFGSTWHTTIALEGDFDAVRLVYLNDGTSGSFTVTSAVLAVTASASDPLNPVDGTGAAGLWVPVTFTNGGAPKSYWEQTQAQPQPSPVTTITLNNAIAGGNVAAGGDGLGVADKAVTYSDWIPLSSLPRSDGSGKFPLLMVRHYCGSGTPRPTGGIYTGSAWDNASNGRVQHNYTNAGDCVSNPGAFTSTTPVSSMIFALVQVLSRARTVVGMIVGDSLSQGTGTSTGLSSFVAQAFMQLSTPAMPMQLVSSAFGGMAPNDYFFNAHALLDEVRPNVVVIQISGRGGGTYSTPAAARACWTRALEFARRVRSLGGVPVFYAPPPDSSETTTTDPNRLLINGLALQAGQQGTFVVDGSALLGLPGNPMTLDPRYTNEGVHPNDAGHAVMAGVFVPMLKKMFGI